MNDGGGWEDDPSAGATEPDASIESSARSESRAQLARPTVPTVEAGGAVSDRPRYPGALGRFFAWLPHPSAGLWVVLAAALVETIVLSLAQWENYLSFITSQGNLGNYNQAFFTTLTGHGWFTYTTNLPSGSQGSLLAVHFSPTFYALLPLYAIHPAPITLIVLKQAALAFAAVPLYGLAKVYFRRDAIPVLFGILYLISPLATNIGWNSADPEDFFAIALLFALYFLARGRTWPFIACWLVAAGTIEAAPPLLILFAIGGLAGTLLTRSSASYFTALQQRRALFVALALAAGWMLLSLAILYSFGPHGGAFGQTYARRYATLGATSLPDVMLQAFLHPSMAAAALQVGGSQKLVFVSVLLIGSGALWLVGGLRYLLPIGGFLGFALLSNASTEFSLGTEYPALVVPFLFAGTVEGLAWVAGRFQGIRADEARSVIRRELEGAASRLEGSVARAQPAGEVCAGWLAAARRHLVEDRLSAAESELARVGRRLGLHPSKWASVPTLYGSSVDVEGEYSRTSGSPVRRYASARTEPSRLRAAWAGVCLAICLMIAIPAFLGAPLLQSPLGEQPGKMSGVVFPSGDDRTLASLLSLIPTQAPVLTTNHLFPQVSGRPGAFTVPLDRYLPTNESLAEDFDHWANRSQFVAVDYQVDQLDSEVLIGVTDLNGFGVRAAEGGAVLLQRGWTAAPSPWEPYQQGIAGAGLKGVSANDSSRYATSLGKSLFHPSGGQPGEKLWQGPNEVSLPLGNYSVRFELEIVAPQSGPQLRLSVTETPALVKDTPEFSIQGETYYAASVAPSSMPAIQLADQTISVASGSPSVQSVVSTLSFNLGQTGYLAFPAFEESSSMSVYLVDIQITEVAPST